MKTLKKILQWILGVAVMLSGTNHFLNPTFYMRMMPPVLPAPLFLIYLSGFFEIVFGILLLIPKFTRFAAFGIVALLLAVFPANIFMAQNAELFSEFSPTALYLRLPLQMILIAWAFWYSKVDAKN